MDIVVENENILIQPCNVWAEKKLSINEYKKEIVDIKKTLSTKFHTGCTICFNEEKNKIRSRRQAVNEFHVDNKLSPNKIQSIGVRYGTLCNSKCMICSHTRSSSWVADSLALGYKVDSKYLFKKNKMPGVDFFFEEFDLSDLKYVEFHGGEPLIQTYPLEFLEKVKQLDQLVVKFNTNLTVLPSTELINLLKKCKRVDFLLSVDDVKKRYEILRYPANWEIFLENIKELKKYRFKTMAYNCLSTLNIFYAPEYYIWAIKQFGNEIHSQFVVDKDILDISNLPTHAKDIVLEKISRYKGNIFDSIRTKLNINNKECSSDLIKYIHNLDSIRNTNYPEVFKEWWTILNTK
jgi:pyruvate-formate lyase-activating enzyme